ncbi:cupin domain-containing protein [Lacunimicrobium album]
MKRLLALMMLVGLGVTHIASAHEPHDMTAHIKILQSVDVVSHTSEPMKATTFTVEFSPGESHPPHRHPGMVYGYVLEGTLEFAIGDDPVKTLKAGDTFHEPTMILHRVGRNPDTKKPAKILVVMVHPKDAKELVILEPTKETPATNPPTKTNHHDTKHSH